jgi:hypothetical protein
LPVNGELIENLAFCLSPEEEYLRGRLTLDWLTRHLSRGKKKPHRASKKIPNPGQFNLACSPSSTSTLALWPLVDSSSFLLSSSS